MRILVVGGGGREHALAWSLRRSSSSPTLFIAPGNAGTATLGTNVPLEAHDIQGLLTFAREQDIDLTVVGPELPLVHGIVDVFEAEGFPVVGPSRAAAQLEGSKAFSKSFMQRHRIPTADFRTFRSDDYSDALDYLDALGAPVVVKASGLAAGKGAIVCQSVEEARDAVRGMLREEAFGAAGAEVVIEEYMEGEEASIFALTDGTNFVLLSPAQDHKRIGEGDTGPNTGGMGAYAPAPVVTADLLADISRTIIDPTLAGMRSEETPYRGFLYVGVMIADGRARVVEFNCRLGDPEAQVILPLLETDMAELLRRQANHDLRGVEVRRSDAAAACIVMASEGYPDAYEKGRTISGLDGAAGVDGAIVFHAGTTRGDDGAIMTSGGRVIGVTAVAPDLAEALEVAYQAVERIAFEGAQYRRDIGQKGLARLDVRSA